MINDIDKLARITDGLRKSFQKGDCKMANRTCYGYDTMSNGELAVNETQAKTVRWIFERYLAGDSLGKIATTLQKQGISSPAGKPKWNRKALSKLLSNEKYTGFVFCKSRCAFAAFNFKQRRTGMGAD